MLPEERDVTEEDQFTAKGRNEFWTGNFDLPSSFDRVGERRFPGNSVHIRASTSGVLTLSSSCVRRTQSACLQHFKCWEKTYKFFFVFFSYNFGVVYNQTRGLI
jgi:hypothetical protein